MEQQQFAAPPVAAQQPTDAWTYGVVTVSYPAKMAQGGNMTRRLIGRWTGDRQNLIFQFAHYPLFYKPKSRGRAQGMDPLPHADFAGWNQIGLTANPGTVILEDKTFGTVTPGIHVKQVAIGQRVWAHSIIEMLYLLDITDMPIQDTEYRVAQLRKG